MQAYFKQFLVVVSLAIFSAGAQANAGLAKKKGCACCHGGVAGLDVMMPHAPSFYDLYSKFSGLQDAEEKMMTAWRENKNHPKASVNATEQKALVDFYLSTEPVETSGKRQMPSKESESAK